MNLLMCAPLCDSKGTVRYFIGAQIDVSGLVMDDVGMESMQDVHKEELDKQMAPGGPEEISGNGAENGTANGVENGHISGDANGDANGDTNGNINGDINGDTEHSHHDPEPTSPRKAGEARNNLLEFVELLNPGELTMVREHGSSIFQPVVPRRERPYWGPARPRVMLKQSNQTQSHARRNAMFKQPNLPGVYDNVSCPFFSNGK